MKCKTCGDECNPGRGGRYCSLECSCVKTVCAVCGEELLIPNGKWSCDQENNIKQHFCNKKCVNIYKKSLVGDKNPFYGKHHTKESREKIINNRDQSFSKTQEFRDKISSITKGRSYPHKGKSMLERCIYLYGEDGQLKYLEYVNKYSKAVSGENNPMFGKPSPTGSGNGWSGWYKGWYFRSIRELSYMINVIERFNIQWETGEQKKTKISYMDINGNNRNYFPDFVLCNKYIIEIKPKKLWNSDLVLRKTNSAIKWCVDNGYKYKIIDPKPLDTDTIKNLYLEGLIKFLPRYELKFLERVING